MAWDVDGPACNEVQPCSAQPSSTQPSSTQLSLAQPSIAQPSYTQCNSTQPGSAQLSKAQHGPAERSTVMYNKHQQNCTLCTAAWSRWNSTAQLQNNNLGMTQLSMALSNKCLGTDTTVACEKQHFSGKVE